MATTTPNSENASNNQTPSSTLWLPPLSLKEQQRLDLLHKRQQRQRRFWWLLNGGFKDKTLWDYLQLLAVLAIPVLIAAGSLWFTDQQSQISIATSKQQHQTDMDLANDQQQETALQTYLDRMCPYLNAASPTQWHAQRRSDPVPR